MKSLSSGLSSHLAGEVTTLATCWKLTRRDSTVMGFTDHDTDIVYAGVTYKAATGFTPSAVATSDSLAVGDVDVEGMLDTSAIVEADIMAGLYDFAELEIFMVNYADLTQGALKLRRGWLGQVRMGQHRFVAEVRGLSQKLAQNLGERYTAACRAQLGDVRCKINLAAHTVTGSVTSVLNTLQFADTARTEAAGIFTFGVLTFTSGPNAGLSIEIKEYSPGKLTLALPLPSPIAVGHSYSLVKGCDKTLATCQNRYANAVNFRGEPHVPGIDKILETAGTRNIL